MTQYLVSVGLVCVVGIIGLTIHGLIGYRVVAFMLLVTVSILAMFLDIVPVLVASFLSALIWDFFFIPPRFTLTVGTAEDRLLLLMYFIVALINAVLTSKIRQMEKEAKAKDDKDFADIERLMKKMVRQISDHNVEAQIKRGFAQVKG